MPRKNQLIGFATIGFLLFFAGPAPLFVFATDYSATNFTVKDPVIEELGGYSQSTNFKMWGTIPYIEPQRGTATNFGIRPGFLAFSDVVLPTLTAVSGVNSGEINVSWTAVANLANATYEVGQATTSGGPYTYYSSQTLLTKTITGLALNQTYFFIIRVKDGLGAEQGFSNEASALPGTGVVGPGGTPPAPPPVPVPPAPPSITETLNNIITRVVDQLIPDFLKLTPQPPAIRYVPRQPQIVFRRYWELIPPEPLRELVLRPLPKEIQHLAGKFPQLGELFKRVGITRYQDLSKLRNLSLRVPGLQEVLSLEQFSGTKDLRVAELSSDLRKRFPTDVIFARMAEGKIDLAPILSISRAGSPQEHVQAITGQTMNLLVKPDGAPKTVRGYLIFKKSAAAPAIENQPQSFSNPFWGVPTAFAQASPPEQELVVSEFEFSDEDGDGIYSANVDTPLVAGEYEIVTVVEHDDRENPKVLRLATVIDPEGYVFEVAGGREVRIPGAVVLLEWLNPQTNEYEKWPAEQYQQKNPQITDVTGQYSFLVPKGYYRLKISAPGYLTYDGKAFFVEEGTGIHENVELRSYGAALSIIDWRTAALIGIALLLLYNFYSDKMRARREGRQLIHANKMTQINAERVTEIHTSTNTMTEIEGEKAGESPPKIQPPPPPPPPPLPPSAPPPPPSNPPSTPNV